MWTALCRWLLIIFNIILALLCAGIIVFAGFLLHGGSVVRQLWYLGMNWLMHDLKEDVPKYLSGLEDLLKISTVNTAIGMIVAASLLLIISVVGIFAAIFAHKRTLISYTIILTVLALSHVAAVVWFDLDQFKTGGFLGRLVQSWMEAFASEERGMPEDRMAALLMQKLRCCGYQNGSDFQKSKAFTKRDTVAGIPMTDLPYPLACCIELDLEDRSRCPYMFTPTNSYIEVGCQIRVKHLAQNYLVPMVSTSLLLVVIEGILIFCACFVSMAPWNKPVRYF